MLAQVADTVANGLALALKAIQHLLEHYDLLLLLGRTLVQGSHLPLDEMRMSTVCPRALDPFAHSFDAGYLTDPLVKLTGTVCQQNKELRASLRHTWLQVLEGFFIIKYPNISSMVSDHEIVVWRGLGARMGLDEDALEREAADVRKEASGGIVGCVWLKCPLYECESPRVAMRCSGCGKVRNNALSAWPLKRFSLDSLFPSGAVLQCALPTQVSLIQRLSPSPTNDVDHRDWTEGRHSVLCKPQHN